MAIYPGDANNNTFTGTAENDVFDGKGGDDVLTGGGGNDTFFGGAGRDTMVGGEGSDRFVVGDDEAIFQETYNGAGGEDTLEISTLAAPVNGSFTADFQGTSIQSIERLFFAGGGQHNVYMNLSNVKYGLASNLKVDGGFGDNFLYIYVNSDTSLDLSGWTFTNWNGAHTGSINIFGTMEDDWIAGTSQRDTVVSGGGGDVILTGGDNDSIWASGNQNGAFLDFGAGIADTLDVETSGDFTGATVKGLERLQFFFEPGQVLGVVDFRADQFGNGGISKSLAVTNGAAASAIVDINMGVAASFDAGNFQFSGSIDQYRVRMFGDADAEAMTGSIAGDSIYGYGGNDTLKGLAGKDSLFGGIGNDIMDSGAGIDKLIGDLGADDMTGGIGKDTFFYYSGADSGVGAGNRDIIRDFVAGTDVINVAGIDAGAAAGDQAFVLDAGGTFAAGEFRIVEANGSTLLNFNLDDDATVEMQILLQNSTGVTVADLVL